MRPELFSAFLIDRDGVLIYAKDGEAIPGAAEWMKTLTARNRKFLIATNHTTSSPEDGATQLASLGFPVSPEHMHTPLTILFDYFSQSPPDRIYARGTPDFLDYLRSKNLTLVNDARADTVLLGFDQTMSYAAVCTAIEAIHIHKANFIALHENRLFKSADGSIDPGLGAWVRAIEYACNTKALIIGKPSPEYYYSAMKRLGVDTSETVMISDDPFGDLMGAKRVGIATVFVTSGKYPDSGVLADMNSEFQPDLILDSITDIPL